MFILLFTHIYGKNIFFRIHGPLTNVEVGCGMTVSLTETVVPVRYTLRVSSNVTQLEIRLDTKDNFQF